MSLAPEVVIELSVEPVGGASTPELVGGASVAPVVSTALDVPGPSAPCTAGSPDMSHDEEIMRRLFVELNREAISILGDGGLVILSSDSEEEVVEEEEAVEEEKDESTGGGSPSRGSPAPISLASPLSSLVTIGGSACSCYLRLGSQFNHL